MGPIGAAMGAMQRMTRGMGNPAQSLYKRRPKLRPKGKQVVRHRRFRLKQKHEAPAPRERNLALSMLGGIFAFFLGGLMAVIGGLVFFSSPASQPRDLLGGLMFLIFGGCILSAGLAHLYAVARSTHC